MDEPCSSSSDKPSPLIIFKVWLINKVRKRKPRRFLVDTVSCILYRATEHENGSPEDLRKPRRIGPNFVIVPHETNAARLKILAAPGLNAQDLEFNSTNDRNRFVALIDMCRKQSSLQEDPYVQDFKEKLSVFTTTWNVGKQSTSKGHTVATQIPAWIPQCSKFDIVVVGLQECKGKHFSRWQSLLLDRINCDDLTVPTSYDCDECDWENISSGPDSDLESYYDDTEVATEQKTWHDDDEVISDAPPAPYKTTRGANSVDTESKQGSINFDYCYTVPPETHLLSASVQRQLLVREDDHETLPSNNFSDTFQPDQHRDSTDLDQHLTSNNYSAQQRDSVDEQRDCVDDEQRDSVDDEQRDSVAEQRDCVDDEQRDSVDEQRDSVDEQRDSVDDEQRDSVDEQRDSVDEQRDSVDEQRDSVAEQRDSVAEQRDSVAEQRDSVAEQRDSVDEQREATKSSFSTCNTNNIRLRSDEECESSRKFRVLKSVSMWSIHLIVFVKEELEPFVQTVAVDSKPCGIGNILGNKGAVGIQFAIHCPGSMSRLTTFAFINSHLAARAERLHQRRSDFAEISNSLFSGSGPSSRLQHSMVKGHSRQGSIDSTSSTSSFQTASTFRSHTRTCSEDSMTSALSYSRTMKRTNGNQSNFVRIQHVDHVWWMGDLNYRIDMGNHGTNEEFTKTLEFIKQENWNVLMEFDQLCHERNSHNVFAGYSEAEIQFPPTYRMELGQPGVYNNKRNQSPSWTDRILWKSQPSLQHCVEISEYDACHDLSLSDHRPVYAKFFVSLSAKHSTDEKASCEIHKICPAVLLRTVSIPSLTLEVAIEPSKSLGAESSSSTLRRVVSPKARRSLRKSVTPSSGFKVEDVSGFGTGLSLTQDQVSKNSLTFAFQRYVLDELAIPMPSSTLCVMAKFTVTMDKEQIVHGPIASGTVGVVENGSNPFAQFQWPATEIQIPSNSCNIHISLHAAIKSKSKLVELGTTSISMIEQNVKFVAPVLKSGLPAGILSGELRTCVTNDTCCPTTVLTTTQLDQVNGSSDLNQVPITSTSSPKPPFHRKTNSRNLLSPTGSRPQVELPKRKIQNPTNVPGKMRNSFLRRSLNRNNDSKKLNSSSYQPHQSQTTSKVDPLPQRRFALYGQHPSLRDLTKNQPVQSILQQYVSSGVSVVHNNNSDKNDVKVAKKLVADLFVAEKVAAEATDNAGDLEASSKAVQFSKQGSLEWVLANKATMELTKLSSYLDQDSFEQVFGMDREAFDHLPHWQQEQRKKIVGLF